jgi:hypothetical protein
MTLSFISFISDRLYSNYLFIKEMVERCGALLFTTTRRGVALRFGKGIHLPENSVQRITVSEDRLTGPAVYDKFQKQRRENH